MKKYDLDPVDIGYIKLIFALKFKVSCAKAEKMINRLSTSVLEDIIDEIVT